jgi:signal transduction histidine kinase
LGLGGFLSCTLLIVTAVSVLGGTLPGLTVVVAGTLEGAFLYASPTDFQGGSLGPDVVALIAFAVVGAAITILVGELAQLAEQQTASRRVEAALRRVATLVARASPADELFAAVTREVGRLIPASFARMARYEADEAITVVAAWSGANEAFPIGSRWDLAGHNVEGGVWRSGRPARIDNFFTASGPLASDARERGVHSAAGAPIIVEGRVWGVMLAGMTVDRQPLPSDTEARLADFTDLLATAIANAESRAELTRLAEEQAALRRVATLAARVAPVDELFAVVTEEVGTLLRVEFASMGRYERDGTVTAAAVWSAAGAPAKPPRPRWNLRGDKLSTLVLQTGRPARIDGDAGADGEGGVAYPDAGIRSTVGTPIVVEDSMWGLMTVGTSGASPLPPDTEARLADFTDLLATAIANAESRAGLAASRARIVAAADETRRRIERDLHDGAQQRLVSLGLELRAAQAALPPQLGEVRAELSQVADGVMGVLDELREIARGIHPAILAEGGLGPALRTLARRSPIPVDVDVRAAVRLPQRVEVATYYIVSETLTNAAKHANASVVHVEVEAVDRILRLSVGDDGDGGADPTRGTGLVGLKDRVEAMGGVIAVSSPLGAGTSMVVELPLG